MSSDWIPVFIALIAVVGTIVTIGGGVVTAVMIPVLRKKWGLEAKDAEYRVHDSITLDAAREAEQWKKNEALEGRAPAPSEVLSRAVDMVNTTSAARGITPPPNVAQMVEAKVAQAQASIPPPAPTPTLEPDEGGDA